LYLIYSIEIILCHIFPTSSWAGFGVEEEEIPGDWALGPMQIIYC
jgi:hypothetical protein